MNLALWIVQALLALLFLFAGGMKLVLPLEKMAGPIPLPGLFLRFIGVCEVLGGLGLILPGLVGIRTGLTPLAAVGLVIIMVGATAMGLMIGDVVSSRDSAGRRAPLGVRRVRSLAAGAASRVVSSVTASADQKVDDVDPGRLKEEISMKVEPQKEHQWLQKLVGEWTCEAEATMGPDKPPEKFAGTESVRSLGGLWVLCEGRGEMPGGGAATTIMTLGYDPREKRFVGTFIGSMMTHLWVYDGGAGRGRQGADARHRGPELHRRGEDGEVPGRDRVQERRPPRADLAHAGRRRAVAPFMTAHYRRKE